MTHSEHQDKFIKCGVSEIFVKWIQLQAATKESEANKCNWWYLKEIVGQ